MAYYLRFNSPSHTALLNNTITSMINIGDKVEIDYALNGVAIGFLEASAGSSSGQLIQISGVDGNWRITLSGNGQYRPNTFGGTGIGNRVQLTMERISSTQMRVTLPQVGMDVVYTISSRTFATDIISRDALIDLYHLKFWSAGVLIHNYDPSASNGTGDTLIDTVGGNNATLINFPAVDADKWIFYSDGGAVVSTVATTWPLFQVAASQQSTAPAVYNSTVALTWPMFAVSANQQSAAPVYESAVMVNWPLFQVAATQSGEAPTVASSVSFDWPLFQAAATQQSSVPVYNSVVDVTWPLFSVSAAQTSVAPDGATINVTWPLFQVGATQSSTVPVYTASVSVEWPLFSVYVDAREVTPEPELDLPISGYGNNRTWFDSVFFRPNR